MLNMCNHLLTHQKHFLLQTRTFCLIAACTNLVRVLVDRNEIPCAVLLLSSLPCFTLQVRRKAGRRDRRWAKSKCSRVKDFMMSELWALQHTGRYLWSVWTDVFCSYTSASIVFCRRFCRLFCCAAPYSPVRRFFVLLLYVCARTCAYHVKISTFKTCK